MIERTDGRDPEEPTEFDGDWSRLDPGPYIEMDGEGPGIYLPVGHWPWNKAQREASFMAREMDARTVHYAGKTEAWLDCDEVPGGKFEGVPCYAFEAIYDD